MATDTHAMDARIAAGEPAARRTLDWRLPSATDRRPAPAASSGILPMLRLELVDITKRYPAVVANDHVGLRVKPGEIHAVLGENGAGKSTLMKIIYGAVLPDAGEIRWNGEAVAIGHPHEARQLGIS